MSETKTYCIGRFLIDVPKEAEINGQGYEFMFGRVNSEKTEIDAKGFATRMTNREAEIKTKKIKSIYQLTKTISPSSESRIFLASRNAFGSIAYGFDAYRIEKNILFSITQTGFIPDHIDSIISRLQKNLLPNLRTREPDEIPTEPGFCIKDGFIADDGSKDQAEYGQIGFISKAWPKVLIVFTTRENGEKSEVPLLERADAAAKKMGIDFSTVKTLRRGVKKVHQFSGEELMEAVPSGHGFFFHSFRWESAGLPNAAFAPNLYLTMTTGGRKNGEFTHPTLTDDQAIQLFDSIVNSIRLRPTGPSKVSTADPSPLFPLGETIATGDICPQSGWWQCTEHNNDARIKVEGGQRQFFKAGQVMPRAVLVGTPTLWQKLAEGIKPFRHSTATSWRLDAFDDATVKSLAVAKSSCDLPHGQTL